jgi:hypothetical protein
MPLPTDLKSVVNKMSRDLLATEESSDSEHLHYYADNLADNFRENSKQTIGNAAKSIGFSTRLEQFAQSFVASSLRNSMGFYWAVYRDSRDLRDGRDN